MGKKIVAGLGVALIAVGIAEGGANSRPSSSQSATPVVSSSDNATLAYAPRVCPYGSYLYRDRYGRQYCIRW